jgi:putative ABC transport system permease protein
MVRNYLKIALRNFWKTKLTSLVSIGSLAVGIACCVLIVLFVKNEWTFDQYHSNANRIYRLWNNVKMPNGDMQKMVFTPYNMSRLMAEDYEELDKYSTFGSFGQQVEYADQNFPETIHIVSKDFFEIFDYKTKAGNLTGALNGLDDIVITEAVAEKYFGEAEAIGQRLNMTLGDEKRSFNVKAVLEEIPSNSSLTFEFLVSDENAKFVFPEPMINTWHMISGTNYIMLKPGVDPKALEAKLPSLVKKVLGDEDEGEFGIFLQPLTDIHLNNDFPPGYARVSNPKYTFILSGIAVLILILGCVNFMILSVGKSAARAKEIGVRKVVGANKSQLGMQLISEGVLLAVFSLIVAVILARITLPLFNELANTNLKMTLSLVNISMFVGLAIFVGFIASAYPAFVISNYQPIKVLKGNSSATGGKHYFKMILVTGQFVLSIFLVTTTVLMQKQLSFLQSKNLGFDLDQVISIPIQVQARGLRDQISSGFTKAEKLKTALGTNANILDLSISSLDFGEGQWIQLGWPDPKTNEMRQFRMNVVDPGYIPALKMEIVAGRNFENDNLSDQRRSIIVNEAFVKAFGMENPIGMRIPNPETIDHEIIGVVKDFHFSSLHTAIEPLILVQNVNIGFSAANNVSIEADPAPKVFARVAQNSFPETIKQIESTWDQIYGDEPFDFRFVNEGLQRQYVAEKNLGEIVSVATILALIIGSMGLFALATLTMNARTKEISVRKVLGAPLKNILYLLSKSYFVIIIIALLISVPMTHYFAESWLSEFEYKISIGFDSFLLAGAGTLLIALLTISFQCLKVASANLAQTLSSE